METSPRATFSLSPCPTYGARRRDGPEAAGVALIEDSIVQASDAAFPEFNSLGRYSDSRPSARDNRSLDRNTKFLTPARVAPEPHVRKSLRFALKPTHQSDFRAGEFESNHATLAQTLARHSPRHAPGARVGSSKKPDAA